MAVSMIERLKRLWASVTARPRYGIAFIVVGATAALLIATLTQVPTPNKPGEEHVPNALVAPMVAGFLLAAVGLWALLTWDARRKYASGNRRQRIERLTRTLKEGLTAAEALLTEIEDADKKLEELDRSTQAARHTAAMNAQAANAVRDLMRDELRTERQRTFRRDLFFLLLGAGLSLLLTKLFS